MNFCMMTLNLQCINLEIPYTLQNLGMDNLKSVRQGKYFELEVNDNDQAQAEKKVDDMCKKLLANLIIEDYKINKI